MAATFFDTPPLRYTGAKWKLADWILSHFPPHDIYVEPYCGGASIFFRKEPSKVEVLNDLNGDVVNFFRVLREQPDKLIKAIDLTPFSREEYDLAFVPSEDPIEKARRFYVLCWQSFGMFGGRKTGWRRQLNINRGTNITGEWNRLDGLWYAVRRLKAAQIESKPALELIQAADSKDTLFYVDPPYVLSSRSQSVGRKRYAHEMTDDDHRQLAGVLHHLKGMVILSGYDSPLYRELFADWKVLTKTATTNGNSVATEYLWLSPNANELGRLPIFEGVKHDIE